MSGASIYLVSILSFWCRGTTCGKWYLLAVTGTWYRRRNQLGIVATYLVSAVLPWYRWYLLGVGIVSTWCRRYLYLTGVGDTYMVSVVPTWCRRYLLCVGGAVQTPFLCHWRNEHHFEGAVLIELLGHGVHLVHERHDLQRLLLGPFMVWRQNTRPVRATHEET